MQTDTDTETAALVIRPPHGSPLPTDHPISLWLQNQTRVATLEVYARSVMEWANWLIEERAVDDPLRATFADALAYRDLLLHTLELKASTVRNKFARLSSLYGFLMRQGILASNPIAGVKLPTDRSDTLAHRYLTLEEIGAFFAAIPSDDSLLALRDRALFGLLLRNGLRVSEAAGAQIGDLVRKGGEWVLELREHGVLDQHIKGGAVGDVVLIPRTMQAIERYLEARGIAADTVLAGEPGAWREEPLFARTRESGRPPVYARAPRSADDPLSGLTARAIRQRMVWYGCDPRNPRNAGLDPALCHPHVCRHTFISWLVELGVPINRIMAATRHRKLESVQHYIHTLEALRENASKAIPY